MPPRSFHYLLACAALAVAGLVTGARGEPVVEQWAQRYNGSANNTDSANGVAVDAAGNVIVTGGSMSASGGWDYYTVKYAPDGAVLWEKRYDNGGADIARPVAVDASGNVIVSGTSAGIGFSGDYYTAKYAAADGALLWEQRHDGPDQYQYWSNAIALDAAGNVIVAGSVTGAGGYLDYSIVKLAAADRALLWEKRYDGPAHGDDHAFAVAVDRSGNVIVTGTTTRVAFTEWDYTTIKYAAADGAVMWSRAFTGAVDPNNDPPSLAVDAVTGDAVMVGIARQPAPSIFDYYTARYAAADGATVWEKYYSHTATSVEYWPAVALDAAGNVLVTGASSDSSGGVSATLKYAAADGAVLWEAHADGPTDAGVAGRAIVVDAAGNAVVSGIGFTAGQGPQGFNFATFKHAAADGALLWEMEYNGTGAGHELFDGLRPLALTPDGGAVVVGASDGDPGTGTNYDWAAVKYAPAPQLRARPFKRPVTAVEGIDGTNSNILFDSYDSRDPAKSTDGEYDVVKRQFNGSLAINTSAPAINLGNAYVFGRLLANGGTWMGGVNFVTGAIVGNFQTVLPEVVDVGVAPTGPPVVIDGNYEIVASSTPGAPTRVRASGVVLNALDTLRLRNPDAGGAPAYVEVWCEGDIDVTGNAQILIDPGVFARFIVGGDMRFAGFGIVNPNRPANLMILGRARAPDDPDPIGSLRYSGSSTPQGLIYAPGYDVEIVGAGGLGSDYCGAIVGRTVYFSGILGVHYDEALADVEVPLPSTVDVALRQVGPLADGTGSVGYGQVLLGTGASRTFTIANNGNVDLVCPTVSVTGANAGEFTVGLLGQARLAPAERTTFTVTFTPTASGPRSAQLRVANNAPGSKNPYDIALGGAGNTAPSLSLPGSPVVVEATMPEGAVVSFSATANDGEDGALVAMANPASGSVFPLGDTTVQVSATDSGGATTNGSFVVRVRDTIAPVITVLGANPAAAPVDSVYADAGATAADSVSGSVLATPSGAVNTAVPGDYTITYTATDGAGNVGTATRTVTVPHTPHADWRVSVFGAQAGNPAVAGDLADPNGNGVVNLLEYAFGGEALGSGPAVLPVFSEAGNGPPTFSFTRYASRSDVTLTVLGADAPGGPWTDLARSTGGATFTPQAPGVTVMESGTGDARAVVVSDAYPISPGNPKRFLRLEVVR